MICTYLTKHFFCSCMVKCANYNVCFLLLKIEKRYSAISNYLHGNKRRKMENVAIHTDVLKASSRVGGLPYEPKVVVENLTFKILTATAASCVNPSFATILVPLFSRLSASSLLIFKKKQRQRKIKKTIHNRNKQIQQTLEYRISISPGSSTGMRRRSNQSHPSIQNVG